MKLRIVSLHDLDKVHELLSLPETDMYNTAGIPGSAEVTRETIKNWLLDHMKLDLFPLIIESNTDGKMLGLISLRLGKPNYRKAEVSYKIHPDAWGNGYATEAVRRVIEYGFRDLKLHRIEAGCAVDNIASVKVLEKSGMHREGVCRQNLPLKSGWADNYEYAILESDQAVPLT